MNLIYRHYEEGGRLCTEVMVPEIVLEVDGVRVGSIAARRLPIEQNPFTDGPGPHIPRYQGDDKDAPFFDPKRAGQLTDGFDRAAWFADQVIEIQRLLTASAAPKRIDHGEA